MCTGKESTNTPPLGAEVAKIPSASEEIARILHDTSVSPALVLECVYYVLDDDLLRAMRLLAALDPAQQAEVREFASALLDGVRSGPS